MCWKKDKRNDTQDIDESMATSSQPMNEKNPRILQAFFCRSLGRPIDMVQLHWPPSLGWQEREYLNAFNRYRQVRIRTEGKTYL